MMVPANRGDANRLMVMASCLTSDLHGAVLGALDAGATNFEEVSASLQAEPGRETLLTVLRELRDAGFVGRSTAVGPPLSVIYRLTGDGQKMVDLAMFVSRWLSRNLEDEMTESFWTSIRNATARARSASATG